LISRNRNSLLAAIVVGLATCGLASAQGQSIIRDLRLASGPDGAPLAQVEAGPGEKRYHLEQATDTLFIAYDCTGTGEGDIQVRVIQPPGTPLDVQDRTCSAAGTEVVVYEASRPMVDNEYVVNLYVGRDEPFLADSLQFTVGDAQIVDTPPDVNPQVVSTAGPVIVDQTGPESVPGGPSSLLLALAGIGVVGLLAVVAWAGWSAMRHS
jgi:hypothetical protein